MDEIVFNFQQPFLLAKEAVNNQFLLHLPYFDNSVPHIFTYVKLNFDNFWNYPNYGCILKTSNITEMNSSNHWIYEATRMEHIRTHDDFRRLKLEPGEMFPIIQPSKKRRTIRSLLLIAARLCLGSFCLLRDIFGGCDQMSKETKRAYNWAIQRMNSMYSWRSRAQTVTNEMFYVVGSELKEHRSTQCQMASIQRDNAETRINQLQNFNDGVSFLRNDDQEIDIREETIHKVAVLCCFHSTLKIFRASLHTFRTHIFTVFAPNVIGFLPLSVSPNSTLQTNLRAVVLQGSEAGSRFTLAIPIWSLMTSYETKLLRQLVPSKLGLVFTVAVPFYQKQQYYKFITPSKVQCPTKTTQRLPSRMSKLIFWQIFYKAKSQLYWRPMILVSVSSWLPIQFVALVLQ